MVELTDGDGFIWVTFTDTEYSAGYGTVIDSGSSDTYDAGLQLVVNGVVFDGALGAAELNGRQVVYAATIGDIATTRRFYVPNTAGEGWARALETFTNTGSTTQTVTFTIRSNSGNDGNFQIISTSSGDTAFTTADTWIINDDTGGNVGGDLTGLHLFGDGSLLASSVGTTVFASAGTQGVAYTYTVTLDPGESASFLHFVSQQNTAADIMTELTGLQALDDAALAGLTDVQLGQIFNWDAVVTPSANDDALSTGENQVLRASVYADNGSGPDQPTGEVIAVNGRAELVGTSFTTAAGAIMTIRANGNLTYNPNGQFDALAAPGSGASNTQITETFTYTLAGGDTATVTITVVGVDSADRLIGTNGADNMNGGEFNDVLIGYLGNDVLNGGNGVDTVSYEDNRGAVFVNLTTGQGFGNSAQGDTYISIENVLGSSAGDFIIGNVAVNRLDGAEGNDTLIGGLGGDALIGGGGVDTASYEDNQGAVFVNLSTGLGFNNAAEGDTYQGIENLKGGLFNDFFIGDAAANRLTGAMGADTLLGAGGADTFVFDYAPGATSIYGSPNVDTILDFTSGQDKIELAASVFTGIGMGTLATGAFALGTTATDGDDRILYDQSTGQLFYDADGVGGTAAVLFAVLDTRPTIQAADFVVA